MKSFDGAQSAFYAKPSIRTAGEYLQAARVHYQEEVINFEEYDTAVDEVEKFLWSAARPEPATI